MAKTFAIIFGVVFVLIGLLGFFPNPLIGPNGLFVANIVHNLFSILIGVVLLVVAFKSPERSGFWLMTMGVVLLLLALLGFLLIPDGGMIIGISLNLADHWLHIVFGLVLLASGFAPAEPIDIHVPHDDGMGI